VGGAIFEIVFKPERDMTPARDAVATPPRKEPGKVTEPARAQQVTLHVAEMTERLHLT
jgi:hypothetical protein